MEIENQTAQTTVDNTEDGRDAGTVQPQEEAVNDEAFEDAGDAGTPAEPVEPPKEPLTQEQNSENARKRREAEHQKELQAARVQATIDALNGTNPYTQKPMTDDADVQEYFTMREIEKNGGDPVGDFAEYHKEQERTRARQAQEDAEQAAWYQSDREAFARKHPDVRLDELIEDKQFQSFAEGKVGRRPLSEIYEAYRELGAEYERRAQEKAAQTLANAQASPGSLSSPNTGDGGFFTREQVQAMSDWEIHKNYDKIRKSMKRWK